MKLAQVLLINVAMVAVALVVYDQLRPEASVPARERAAPRGTDAAALEQRLSALEARRHPSSPALARPDEPEPAAGEPPITEPAPEKPRPTGGESRASAAAPDVVTAEEIRRFRRVREAVRREDAVARNKAWVDRALDKLSVRLTAKQRAKIHVAYAAFEPRVKEIWTEVKEEAQKTIAAGGDVDRATIVTSTTARIQQEFARTITDVVDHPADAEAVAKALMPDKR